MCEERFSNFLKFIKTYKFVLTFVEKFKSAVSRSKLTRFVPLTSEQVDASAYRLLIMHLQTKYYPDVINYFRSTEKKQRRIPNIVTQLNLFLDRGLLRVKCKLKIWSSSVKLPLLLPSKSFLTELIINHFHSKLCHAGVYGVFSELRKSYWIPCTFSTVKRCIRSCVQCRRLNRRTISLTQNAYREFRLDPPSVPFRYVFSDHIGPYYTKDSGSKTKVYLLIITCLWSHAVNLVISRNLTVDTFHRAFQLHIYSHGLPERCYSDSGSQLVAGANIITDFLKDSHTQVYFREQNIRSVNFEQYPKGHSALGSLIQSIVKLVKKLIIGSIRNLILPYLDF